MSPLQVGALASGVFFGATQLICCLMEFVAHEPLVPFNVSVLIAIGTTVSWSAFFSGYQCGRLNRLEARLHRDIPGYGQLCTEDGHLDAAREYARAAASPVVGIQRGRTLAPVE